MVQQTEGTSSATAAVPPPAPTQRRPRVREVSSRFMTPSPNFGADPSKSPLPSQQQRSVSAQRQRRRLEMEGDENRPLETQRSLESPFTTLHKKQQQHLVKSSSSSSSSSSTRSTPLRKPDTPIFHTVADSSRIRPNPRSAAAKLLQSSGISNSSDLRSSMPDADHLPSTSNRFLSERNLKRGNNDNLKPAASPFSRSMNSPFNTSDSVKAAVAGTVSLPPVPKSGGGADTRKAKKVCSHQEDVHSLKLLHNHWLQLRLANAKAEAAMIGSFSLQVEEMSLQSQLIQMNQSKSSSVITMFLKKSMQQGAPWPNGLENRWG